MNEPTTSPPTVKPARKRTKPTTPRAPRTIDPGVAAIRKKASDEIKEYHRAQASAGILATILDKRLAQLTYSDKAKLFDHLKQIVTPALSLPA